LSRVWKRVLLLMAVSLCIVTGLWMTPLQGFERSTGLSALYALRGTRPPPETVVIVALDAASAQRLDVPRRPDLWPRRLHATLVDGLARSGAAAIGFDLLFEQPGTAADDAALADALARAGNVVLAERVVRSLVRGGGGDVLGGVDRLIRPMPLLADAAWVTAPFVLPKTLDGVFEFWTFPTGSGGSPSMPVRLFERWSLAHGHETTYPSGAGDRLALNLYGPFGTLPIIPYAEALERLAAGGTLPEVAGKVVLVGLAEPNQSLQFDAYRTPYSTPDGVDINGVELAATAIANMAEGSSLHRVGEGSGLGLVLGWTALLALVWGFARAQVATALTVGLSLLLGVGVLQAFAHAHVWLPLVFPLLVCPVLVGGVGMAIKYRLARGRHRRLQQLIGLDARRGPMARLSSALETHADGHVVRAVCLSSDIKAYTALAEQLSPAQARDALNGYLSLFLPLVESYGGDVTDLVGDSIMCLWVVGKDEGDACRRALAAAAALDEQMNRRRPAGALPTRFGLHVGEVFFGEVGVGDRVEIRPVGDVVNTASRIQTACKSLGVSLLVSEAVARHGDPARVHLLGRFQFKGKQEPIAIAALDSEACPEAARAQFDEGLGLFDRDEVDAAGQVFAHVLAQFELHGPARFYTKVCASPGMHGPGGVVVLARA
jgi:adenylate cyclase